MKRTLIKTYYFLLIALVLGMVANTIVTGSQFVSTGRKIAELEKEKKVLVDQQRTFETETSQEISMASISRFAQAQGYAPITQLAAVHYHSQVASR